MISKHRKNMKVVKFNYGWRGYSKDEVAGFPIRIADGLIKDGVAAVVRIDSDREKLNEQLDYRSLDWKELKRITRDQTGNDPVNTKHALKILREKGLVK
jgi:hypothetical protein